MPLTKYEPKQKFQIGDTVKVVDKIPFLPKHFACGREAKIGCSYAQMFGGAKHNLYSLVIDDVSISWYEEKYLTKVKQ